MAKKQYIAPDYIRFVYTREANAQYCFSNYTDGVGALGTPGKVVFISKRLDKLNRPEPYQYGFSMRDRNIREIEGITDIQGYSIVEFLRNHPECKNSPNGRYITNADGSTTQIDIFFKEVNEESDAKKMLDANDYRRNAENIAASLALAEVYEINALFGIFKTTELMARHALLDLAGNKPQLFMDAYENPQRRSLSVVRKAIDKGILKVQGTVVIWNKTQIGNDEQDAATNLQKDVKMLEALESAIKKVN